MCFKSATIQGGILQASTSIQFSFPITTVETLLIRLSEAIMGQKILERQQTFFFFFFFKSKIKNQDAYHLSCRGAKR